MAKVCLLSSEFAPLAKTGGLADVLAGLSRSLHQAGHDVRVFLPAYGVLDLDGLDPAPVEFARDVPIELGHRRHAFTLWTARIPGEPDATRRIHLVRCPELYDRREIYSGWNDEHVRFAYFCCAVLASCQRMGWAPDVFHCNDWHTAMLPLYKRTLFGWDTMFRGSRTLLTIHNLGYQGWFPSTATGELGLEPHRSMLHQEDLNDRGVINFLKTGIMHADLLSTVSRTYAHEIQTEEYGEGLHEMLRARADHLVGIVNGVDYADWNPTSDPFIPHHFSADDLEGKRRCRTALLQTVNRPSEPEMPVMGLVSRLTAQKGIELLFETLPVILSNRDVRLVALGSGEPRYEEYFEWLQRAIPDRVCFYRGYNNELAHLIEAGADIFLMPSRFEPCGLNQMYSMRYGTVPIVRRTGGLADTVTPWDPVTGEGTGFVFEHHTPQGAEWAMNRALDTWANPEDWRRLMLNGMHQDFSWEARGPKYVELYRWLAGHR